VKIRRAVPAAQYANPPARTRPSSPRRTSKRRAVNLPDHDQLHHYWTQDPEGLAQWADHPHPYAALYREILKHVKEPAKAHAIAAAWYHDVFHRWPAEGHGGKRAARSSSRRERKFDPLQPRDPHDGKWIDTGSGATSALTDALKLAGKADLAPGEHLRGSGKVDGYNGTVRMALVERDGHEKLRLGIGGGGFGGRDDEAGPWRAGPDRTAAINADRKKLRDEQAAIGRELDTLDANPSADPARKSELEKRYAELDDMDTSDVFPNGFTSEVDPSTARQLHTSLSEAIAAAEAKLAQGNAHYDQIDALQEQQSKLKYLGRKWTPAEEAHWDDLQAKIDKLTAQNGQFDYQVFGEGTLPGQWADIHYQVELDDYSVGVWTDLAAVPHGSTFDQIRHDEQFAQFETPDVRKFLRLLSRFLTSPSGRSVTRQTQARAADVAAGAMVALIPSAADRARLAVDAGESADQLHLTLAYLGKAAEWPAEARAAVIEAVRTLAEGNPPVEADGFAISAFNPTGDEPCIVLGVGGDELNWVHDAVIAAVNEAGETVGVDVPEQRLPWVPHVTLVYTDDLGQIKALVDRTGPITFDAIRVAFAGEAADVPLTDTEGPDEDTAALIAALAAVTGRPSARAWEAEKHPRRPKGAPGGGQFLSLTEHLTSKLKPHRDGRGHGDPFEGFSREQLRKVAKARGHQPRRGATREELAATLHADLIHGSTGDRLNRLHTLQPRELHDLFRDLSNQDNPDSHALDRVLDEMDRRAPDRADGNPLAGHDLRAMSTGDLFDAWERHKRHPEAVSAIEQELSRRDAEHDRLADLPEPDQTSDNHPHTAQTLEDLDNWLIEQQAGDDERARKAARDRAIDGLIAKGWEYRDAYAAVYGLDPDQLLRDEKASLVNLDRRPGETLEATSKRLYAEWVYLRWMQAETDTNGYLLNKRGRARGVNALTLFSGPAHVARAYASDELKAWWELNGRRTYTEFRADLLGRAKDIALAKEIRLGGNGQDFGI